MSKAKGAGNSRFCLPVVLFFLVLTLVGLFTCGDYGLPCDEPAEQVILRENMKEYAARFLGEDSNAVLYYDRLGIQCISESVERDHGECAYYLAAPMLTLAEVAPDILMLLWHMYTWLLFMLGTLAVYSFCRETGLNQPLSCAGSLLLYLCPRFFAEGHYNNKDMVLLTLVLCTLWLGVRFLKKPSFLRGILFSFMGAMAMNTKIVGVFAWGLMGLGVVVLVSKNRAWNGRMVAVAAATIGSFLVFYTLLTPAIWGDPIGYVNYLFENASGFTRWPGVVVFRGTIFEHAVNPLPRYYLPYMMLVTLPLYVLPLAATGQISVLLRIWKQKGKAMGEATTLSLIVASLLWFVPLFFAALTRPLVYNGWRHFYFTYAGIAVLAAHGTQVLWMWGKKRGGAWQKVGTVVLCTCFIFSAVGMVQNHPYQYGYYNVLARENAQTDMELDYWDVSTKNAMQQLLVAKRDKTLPIQLGARDDMSMFGVTHAYEVMKSDEKAMLSVSDDPNAPYLFLNTTYAKIYRVAPPAGYHLLLEISSYGNSLCAIYERNFVK